MTPKGKIRGEGNIQNRNPFEEIRITTENINTEQKMITQEDRQEYEDGIGKDAQKKLFQVKDKDIGKYKEFR